MLHQRLASENEIPHKTNVGSILRPDSIMKMLFLDGVKVNVREPMATDNIIKSHPGKMPIWIFCPSGYPSVYQVDD